MVLAFPGFVGTEKGNEFSLMVFSIMLLPLDVQKHSLSYSFPLSVPPTSHLCAFQLPLLRRGWKRKEDEGECLLHWTWWLK